MGTTFAIVLYARDSAQASGAARAAFARIAELDRRLTDYRDDSEAARAAREAVDRPVRVSDDLYRVLVACPGDEHPHAAARSTSRSAP